jgi:hypothetical protein
LWDGSNLFGVGLSGSGQAVGPPASGQIEYTSVSEAKRSFISTAPQGSSSNSELGYSYFVAGNTYSGRCELSIRAKSQTSLLPNTLIGAA